MHIDFKITTWERVELPDSLTKEELDTISEKIVDGTFAYYSDIEEYLGVDLGGAKKMDGFDDYMSPDENGGSATVELLDDDGNRLIANGE